MVFLKQSKMVSKKFKSRKDLADTSPAAAQTTAATAQTTAASTHVPIGVPVALTFNKSRLTPATFREACHFYSIIWPLLRHVYLVPLHYLRHHLSNLGGKLLRGSAGSMQTILVKKLKIYLSLDKEDDVVQAQLMFRDPKLSSAGKIDGLIKLSVLVANGTIFPLGKLHDKAGSANPTLSCEDDKEYVTRAVNKVLLAPRNVLWVSKGTYYFHYLDQAAFACLCRVHALLPAVHRVANLPFQSREYETALKSLFERSIKLRFSAFPSFTATTRLFGLAVPIAEAMFTRMRCLLQVDPAVKALVLESLHSRISRSVNTVEHGFPTEVLSIYLASSSLEEISNLFPSQPRQALVFCGKASNNNITCGSISIELASSSSSSSSSASSSSSSSSSSASSSSASSSSSPIESQSMWIFHHSKKSAKRMADLNNLQLHQEKARIRVSCSDTEFFGLGTYCGAVLGMQKGNRDYQEEAARRLQWLYSSGVSKEEVINISEFVKNRWNLLSDEYSNVREAALSRLTIAEDERDRLRNSRAQQREAEKEKMKEEERY